MCSIILKFLVVVSCLFLLTGCGGGGANITQSSQTIGQELMDLEKSYKQGIITEKDSEDAKDDILERYE